MKFNHIKRKSVSAKSIMLVLLVSQFISSCKRDDDFKPIPQPTPVPIIETTEILKSFKDYTFSNKILVFPDVVEGRLLLSGVHNKTNSIGWTHPSVLYFKDKWNNFKYWMAITPYPSGVNEYENPTIFCSDDGLNWKEPKGIFNPIEKTPLDPGYNSDVNLLLDNGTLYCFWRGTALVSPATGIMHDGRTLLFRSSRDGAHWSEKKEVANWSYNGIDLIAPSVLKEEGKYYCYAISSGETTPGRYFTNNSIRRTAVNSIDDIRVDKALGYNLVNIENRPWGNDEDPWHLEVKKFQEKWYILLSTTKNGKHGSQGRLFFGVSDDGINFKFGSKPVCPITYAYKSSFELSNSKKNGVINVKLWRTTSLNWSIFYDEFSLESYFDS